MRFIALNFEDAGSNTLTPIKEARGSKDKLCGRNNERSGEAIEEAE